MVADTKYWSGGKSPTLKPISLHDKRVIETFLRKNVYLHVYSLGDLDDFFWPYTTWYGAEAADGQGLSAIVLVYAGQSLPVVLALSEQMPVMQALLRSLTNVLPARFYAHLSPGLEAVLAESYQLEPHGVHDKMGLRDRTRLQQWDGVDCAAVVRLGRADMDDVWELYRESYPENSFDPRMLDTGQYFGLRKGGDLVSVAGVHVYSDRYGVAALGNVATHPAHRNQGHGARVVAQLCRSLLETVEHVGLNVKADNAGAIACYEKLGFEVVASYGEFMVEVKR